ncbi:MAG: amidase family protein [Erythrobacter sp.]|jgi:amidase|uniref:amidase family protein n=1 Tax=Erythrobacter sp. TaxID=1042 RepID=UPI002B48E3D3|nr:amidase family protein [Erythrobacter sp.]WRH71352.1 MAG: amidase family protein [Erythrobacter sp.]
MAYPQLTNEPGALATAAAIREGRLSVAEAVDAAIVRLEHDDASIDALAVPNFEAAYAEARALDAAGPREDQPLFGVPMTIKESFDVAGLPTTFGHPEHKDKIAPRDALLVRRLKAAGAVIIGKTNVPVDLTDWQSFNPVYGRTMNPHDPERSPGGSSGGSAAAVASGMVPCDYGTDIGGSVRVPAHFCGVWGHKTTWGLIPKHGHESPAISRREGFIAAADGPLSIAGPLARNAADLAALTIAGAEVPLRRRAKPLKNCRILALTELPGGPLDDSVRVPTEAAYAALERAGVKIDHSSDLLPDQALYHRSYLKMMNIVMSGGAPAPDGKRATATDWFALMNTQAACIAQWEALFETYDFVLVPPAPVLAVPHADKAVFRGALAINGEEVPGGSGLVYAGIATFPNLPATVLPIGSADYLGSQLPCGMQVIGPRWADLDCIAAAESIGNILHR